MSKRRGLSVEEKRTRLLELFFEKKSFFQLKELEKMGHKEKGITSMSVKEILQSLVDDGLVDSERIGTSNYFWAFPSKAANIRKRRLEEVRVRLVGLEGRRAQLKEQVEAARLGREESDERTELLGALEEKKRARTAMDSELETLKSCDPEVLRHMREQTAVAVEATNRWTENVFSMKSWCKDKFSVEESELDKQFGIPDDFDYV